MSSDASGTSDQKRFDGEFWADRWADGHGHGAAGSMVTNPANPHMVDEVSPLPVGTALDAGCGAGAEAIWLAQQGWTVTGVDISTEALAIAAERAGGVRDRTTWVPADLSTWAPSQTFELVATCYAHASISQLDLYRRLSEWVSPRGTLLIIGHLTSHGHRDSAHGDSAHGDPGGHLHAHHEHHHPEEASVTSSSVVGILDPSRWQIDTAEHRRRNLGGRVLDDVVVRATRLV